MQACPGESLFQFILQPSVGEALLIWTSLFMGLNSCMVMILHFGPIPFPISIPLYLDHTFPLATEKLMLSLSTKPQISLQAPPGESHRHTSVPTTLSSLLYVSSPCKDLASATTTLSKISKDQVWGSIHLTLLIFKTEPGTL